MNLKKLASSCFFVFVFILFLTTLVFWPIFFGKISLNANALVSFSDLYGQNLAYKNTTFDHLREFFPYYKFSFDSFRNLQIPFWNPYAFSGQPFIASFQTAVFYPFNLLIFIMSLNTFWNVMKMIPMVLGTYFMYMYLRNLELEKKKMLPIAALYGALTFGFGPLLFSWTEEVLVLSHALIWLPLALFSIDKFKKGRGVYLALLSLCVVFSIFAGSPQVTGFLLIFLILYAVFVKRFLAVFLSILLGCFLASVQLLPTLELYLASFRSQVSIGPIITRTMLLPFQLVTYLAPDFFGNPASWNYFAPGIAKYYESMLFFGISALIFAIFSIYFAKRDRIIAFYAIIGVVFLSLTFNLPTSRLFFLLPIPIITSGIANRVLFIPAFCFSALGAIGFNYFLTTDGKKHGIFKIIRYIFYLYIAIFIYFVFVVLNYILVVKFKFPYTIISYPKSVKGIVVSSKNLIIPIAVFGLSSVFIIWGSVNSKLKENLIPLAIICLLLLHSLYFAHKLYSFADKNVVFPQKPILTYLGNNQGQYRSLVLGGGVFENNYPTYYSLFWPEGYEGLNNKSYAEFILQAEGRDVISTLDRSDVRLDKSVEALSGVNVRNLLDILGVKYVVADADFESLLSGSNFSKVFEQKNDFHNKTFSVYENKTVMPRAFLASNYEGPPQVESTNKTTKQINLERRALIVGKLFSQGFDWRNVLILEEPSPISPQFGDGSADIVSYKPNEVIVKTKSQEPKLLFLTDNYYPGWKAKVDGEETKILRADYTFRAVPLRSGEHIVRFYFDSDSFKLGLVISGLALVALVVFSLAQSRRRG